MTDKIKDMMDSPIFDMFLKGIVICLLPWAIWVTNNVFACKSFMQKGDRFSDRDALELEKDLIQIVHAAETRIDGRIDRLPPEEWRVQIRQSLSDSRRIEIMIRDFEKEFSKDFVRWSELPKEVQK